MSALFPDHASPFDARFIEATWFNGAGVTLGTALLRECQRCGAWITAVPRHEAWHRSVDTDQTTDVSHRTAVPKDGHDWQIRQADGWWQCPRCRIAVAGNAMLAAAGPCRPTMVFTDTQGNRHDGSTGSSITDQSDAADGEGTRREGR